MFVLFNMLSRKLHDFILSQVYKYTKKIIIITNERKFYVKSKIHICSIFKSK